MPRIVLIGILIAISIIAYLIVNQSTKPEEKPRIGEIHSNGCILNDVPMNCEEARKRINENPSKTFYLMVQ